jgi:hypothetical protein
MQDISTAPADGTVIRATRGGIYNDVSYRKWEPGDAPLPDDKVMWRDINGFPMSPTHWMPRTPRPPARPDIGYRG